MKILVVSATEKEILPTKNYFKTKNAEACVMKYSVIKDYHVDFLITGIGGVSTTYSLTKSLGNKKYDLIINAGIAGSYNPDSQIGEVVFVQTDEFADLGIEDKDKFYTLFEKGFINNDDKPYSNSKLINPQDYKLGLRSTNAITVNKTHGNAKNIELFKNKFNADVESMEGAAFTYVCLLEGVKFMQIRSISNYVREREEANWDISLAIENLNKKLIDIIKKVAN